MRILNFTPHDVVILDGAEYRADIRKYVATDNTTEVARIPSSGILSAKIETAFKDIVNGIPVYRKSVTGIDKIIGIDEIPESVCADDIIVVSALYASAYAMIYGHTEQLYTISDPVYDVNGDSISVVGCRGICEMI